MKFLVLVFFFTLAANVNAGLISAETEQTNYNNGDTVTVDIFVNNLNPALDFLELDFGFDDSLLSFVENSWFDSNGVFDFGAFGDAFAGFSADTLVIQANFLNGITDVLGTSFKLGELQFTALGDVNMLMFSSSIVTAQDVNFNDVEPQATVSAPAGLLLCLVSLGLFLIRGRQANI
jgi:hypothetical protein